jgi:hypothetical protein
MAVRSYQTSGDNTAQTIIAANYTIGRTGPPLVPTGWEAYNRTVSAKRKQSNSRASMDMSPPEEFPRYERAALVCGALDAAATRTALQAAARALRELPDEEFSSSRIRVVLSKVREERGADPQDLWGPLNVALTGRPSRRSPAAGIARLGKTAALSRIERAVLELSTVA